MLNDARKAAGYEIADRVRVHLRAGGAVKEAAVHHSQWIAGEVLAEEWEVADADAGAGADGFDTLMLDGDVVGVRLEKAA
jgi:isoleucyl-tRNA synthetase